MHNYGGVRGIPTFRLYDVELYVATIAKGYLMFNIVYLYDRDHSILNINA